MGDFRHHEIGSRPLINLYEGWQDEAGIDATLWTLTDPATGLDWVREDGTSIPSSLVASTRPNANETARIRSNQRWILVGNTFGLPVSSFIIRKTVLEFEFNVDTIANLDNAATFMGFTTGIADTRATGSGLMGWGFTADVLTAINNAAAETWSSGFGEDLSVNNVLRLEISNGLTVFYLNGAEVATHDVPANMSATPSYLNFFFDTEAGGACRIELGIIRVWYEDFVR